MGKVDKETIRLAAEAGAKAAIAQWEKERAKAQIEKIDEHLDESVYDILDMMERNTSNLFVDSIKNSVARTATLVKHIETMLGLYRVYCEQSGKPEDLRRWHVTKALYIDDYPKTNQEIADQENVTDRTIRRDVEDICEQLSALLFGIEGVKRD